MDEKTEGQLRVIRKVIAVMQAADIPAWLFGGWGLDARIGRITREHGDVEFWVERIHAERSKAVLVGAPRLWRRSRPRRPASSRWTMFCLAPPTLTGGQTDRSASPWGDGLTGCSRQDPSATSPGCSMARRYWP
jgi:hypothetical protein